MTTLTKATMTIAKILKAALKNKVALLQAKLRKGKVKKKHSKAGKRLRAAKGPVHVE